jgi:hypothetical protein
MSLSLVTQIRKESNLKGYSPRVGIEIEGIAQNFSSSAEFFARIATGLTGITPAGDLNWFGDSTTPLDTTLINVGDKLTIATGINIGEYYVEQILSATLVQLTVNLSGAATNQQYAFDRVYQGETGKIPSIKQYSKELGGFAPEQDASFGILNQELFSNIFATYADVELMTIDMFLYFDDGTTIRETERTQIYSGLIRDVPSISFRSVNFNVTDSVQLLKSVIGDLLTDADAANGVNIPDEDLGKMKPKVYGDHTFYLGDISTSVTGSRKNNMTPIRYLGYEPGGKFLYMISDHELATDPTTADIWAWDSRLDRMVQVQTTLAVESNDDTDGCIISFTTANLTYGDILFGDTTVSNEANVGVGDWVDDTEGCDADADTFAISTIATGDAASTKAKIDLNFDSEYNPDRVLSGVSVYAKFNLTKGSGLTGAQTHLNINLNDQGAAYSDGADHGVLINIVGGGDYTDMIADVTIEHYRDLTGANTESVAKVYEVWKIASYRTTDALQLYFGGVGRPYGTWIDDRDTGDGYSENHADSNNSGSLIENGAGIVESIYRDILGLGNESGVGPSDDTDLLRDSFNIASNDLSTSALSFGLTKQTQWIGELSKLLETIKSLSDIDSTGKLRLNVFGAAGTFSASGDTVANSRDIFEYNPTTAFTIVSGINDKLHFTHPGPGSIGVTITAGVYVDGFALAAEIQSNLSTVIGGSTCTYVTATGIFTVTIPSATALRWSDTDRQIGRFIGFQIASDTAAGTDASDYPIWANSYNENPILKNSLNLVNQSEGLYTDVSVNYNQNDQGSFNNTVQDTDTTSHSDLVANTYLDPWTRDQTTAEIYMDFLLDRLSRKHRKVKFRTFLNAIHLEKWDIINVRHPILEGIYGTATMNSKQWIVLTINYDFRRMGMSITAIEL